ncbi:hypothetical protein PGTUg99_006477 [Puccinia graminis f. sp. tritici]|uniref:Bromodomain-containing protein n=1 Tax=Puccinia graminis f. sp. tritici TaxID=56615 RepID=A0A5B0R419_PUCGR|nr:hypothetical protein PGTUg99_006477 [Puccinia graminis f. sp. tritici]
MSTIVGHHERSPETDLPVNSPEQTCPRDAGLNSATWSSPSPAFPVSPRDVTEAERPLDKSIEPFQPEISPLSSSLTVVSSEFKADSSDPNESSHPKQTSAFASQPEQPPQPVEPSPLPPVTDHLSLLPPPPPPPPLPLPPIQQTHSNGTQFETSQTLPVHLPPCSPSAPISEPDSSDRPAHTDHTVNLEEGIEHAQPTAHTSDGPLSLSAPPTHDVPTLPTASVGTAPPPATANDHPPPPSVSDSPSSADLNIHHPTLNPSLPEPSDNSPPPIPVDSIANTEQADSSSAVIPTADPQQVPASLAHPTADSKLGINDYPAACSSHPPETAPAAASINSLSPLSDVPSASSPPHAIESPTNQSSQLPTLRGPSSASFKRQPSPSMYESSNNVPRQTDDSPNRLNGSQTEPNGQSAHKRPRLDSNSSVNPHLNSSLSNPLTGAPQTLNYPHANVSLHSTVAVNPTPSMTETLGFVPGTPGTRFTKDQHRFAVSVTKQLKKHRSAGPFLAPVDPVALNIPDYFNVVKQPMDLSTIETRLAKAGKPCHYRSVEEFVADVQLVFSNCYMYNGPPATSPYSRMALDLSIQFETQMKKMPPDEPMSHASTSRSPSLAKPPTKPKQNADTRLPPPALKRKNGSPAINPSSTQPGHHFAGQKRRSTSPQHPRKKARRTSMNDPSFQRPRSETWDQSTRVGATHSAGQVTTGQHMISNAPAELKFCKEILREVNKKAYSKFVWPFYEPVDIVKLGIPDYPKYVKTPMDLETMKLKLKNNQYPNGAAFADDFRLMLDNCYVFNPTGPVRECGKQLERLFEAKWAERPPEEIPAPSLPHVASVPTTTAQLDTIQELQMQVAQLAERLNVVNATHPGLVAVHPIPGTGPPKKNSAPRAPASTKSSPNLNNSGPVVQPSTLPAASKGKSNSAGSAKPKQTHGGARRKSAGSALTPSAKRQAKAAEQPPLPGQLDQPELARELYQPPPSTAASLPPVPPSAGTAQDFEPIDYEQKKDLALQIQNAVEPTQSDAINLIRNSRPDLVAADGEEIELDIDALDDHTLYQLYQLVCVPLLPPAKPKKPKPAASNGKPKGGRKAGPGATRKSMPTPMPSYAAPVSQVSGGPHAEPASISQYPNAHVSNGHEHGTKPKVKKPRASIPGPPKRKGIDESLVTASIKALTDKLDVFSAVTDPQPQHPNYSNGVSSANPALGLNSSAPPPAGPVEYASSSSESDSESDDDSD